jgi:hypothetical protein
MCVCFCACVCVCVCLDIMTKSGRQRQWIRTHWILKVNISGPLKEISHGDWKCSERGIDLSNVKWVLMADGIANSLRYCCTLYQESLPLYPNCNPGFGVLGKVRNFIPIHLWTIRSRQTDWEFGRQNWSFGQKMASGYCQPYCCSKSESLLLWHHRGLTAPGIWEGWGFSWPVAMAA